MTAAHAAVFWEAGMHTECMWNAMGEMRASVRMAAARTKKKKNAGQRRNRKRNRGLRSRATLSFHRMMAAASHIIMFTN